MILEAFKVLFLSFISTEKKTFSFQRFVYKFFLCYFLKVFKSFLFHAETKLEDIHETTCKLMTWNILWMTKIMKLSRAALKLLSNLKHENCLWLCSVINFRVSIPSACKFFRLLISILGAFANLSPIYVPNRFPLRKKFRLTLENLYRCPISSPNEGKILKADKNLFWNERQELA